MRFETVSRILKEEMAKPYQFGRADCFLLGCRVADALDGSRDMTKQYAGTYKTLLGAQRALKKLGHGSLTELLAGHLAPIAPAKAVVGDLAVIQHGNVQHVGICLSSSRFVTKTERGASFHDLREIVAAFRA